MAAEPTEITPNHDPITESEIRYLLDVIVAKLARFEELITPELIALLDRYVNNPAAKWRRRNGGTPVQ